jgi:hypothetical protein
MTQKPMLLRVEVGKGRLCGLLSLGDSKSIYFFSALKQQKTEEITPDQRAFLFLVKTTATIATRVLIGSIRTPLFSIQAHVTQNLVLRAEVASRVCASDLLKQDIGMAQVCRFDGTGIKTAVPQPENSSKYKPNWQ